MNLKSCKITGDGIWVPKDVIKEEMSRLNAANEKGSPQYDIFLELLEAIETGIDG